VGSEQKASEPRASGPSLTRAVRTLAVAARGLEKASAPLTLAQYRVLALIVTAPERASRLAAQVDTTRAAMTGVLDALEGHGWIVREDVAGDRRGVSLTVTEAGADALATADASMGAWLSEVLDCADHAEQVLASIGEFGDALRALREGRMAKA
jgi:DNA-binding MarR family transcriptional regulator